jgi:hypothetical protein
MALTQSKHGSTADSRVDCSFGTLSVSYSGTYFSPPPPPPRREDISIGWRVTLCCLLTQFNRHTSAILLYTQQTECINKYKIGHRSSGKLRRVYWQLPTFREKMKPILSPETSVVTNQHPRKTKNSFTRRRKPDIMQRTPSCYKHIVA